MMALPKVFLNFFNREKKGKLVTFPINPDIGPPPIGSPIIFGKKKIGEIIGVNDKTVTAVIKDKKIYTEFFKTKETLSMGYRMVEEKDKK